MGRTRIRWRNVARLAAGAAAMGLLVVVVPGLLGPPEPTPMPPDVGLAGGSQAAYAFTPAARHRSRGGEQRRAARPRPRQPAAPERQGHHDPNPDIGSPPSPPVAEPHAPPPPPIPTPPIAPAPAPEPPPAPQPAPQPAPEPPAHSAPPAPPRGPSQFGFEH